MDLTLAYSQTDPLGGSTIPGVESDIYACLVVVWRFETPHFATFPFSIRWSHKHYVDKTGRNVFFLLVWNDHHSLALAVLFSKPFYRAMLCMRGTSHGSALLVMCYVLPNMNSDRDARRFLCNSRTSFIYFLRAIVISNDLCTNLSETVPPQLNCVVTLPEENNNTRIASNVTTVT